MKENKIVFIDRDGVINNVKGYYYVWEKEKFHINPSVKAFLKVLNEAGYLLVLISNQGGIAKGLYGYTDTDALHEHLKKELAKEGIELAEAYYCPHHPDHGKCLCRKPLPLMIEKGLARFRANAGQSWMIGDAPRDIEAGKAAGVHTIKVEQNQDLMPLLDKILHSQI
jgi:D-glycero-D-manno-heptose 1,7-bisphosphate phosphatase